MAKNLSLPHQSRFLNNYESLEYTTLCFIIRTKIFKVITMMENYDESVEISPYPKSALYS